MGGQQRTGMFQLGNSRGLRALIHSSTAPLLGSSTCTLHYHHCAHVESFYLHAGVKWAGGKSSRGILEKSKGGRVRVRGLLKSFLFSGLGSTISSRY